MSPKLLLIDDDIGFAKLLRAEGKRHGAKIDWYRSFAELERVGFLGQYDGVIADLSADPVTGIEIAQYATAFFSDLPVLLINDDDAPGSVVTPIRRMPPSVQARIPKASGAASVVRSAINMCVGKGPRPNYPAMPRDRATRYLKTA